MKAAKKLIIVVVVIIKVTDIKTFQKGTFGRTLNELITIKKFPAGIYHLKACVHYFFEIFIFPPNDSPSKTMKNVFVSSRKLFSFSRYSNFCDFPFLSTLSRFKRANRSRIIYDVMNWLA